MAHGSAAALVAGDDEKAQRYAERAACRRSEDPDERPAAILAAHLALFELITDQAEVADLDDSTWLDAAADVLPHGGRSRFTVRIPPYEIIVHDTGYGFVTRDTTPYGCPRDDDHADQAPRSGPLPRALVAVSNVRLSNYARTL